MRKYRVIKIITIVACLLIAAYFLMRGSVLNLVLEKIKNKLEEKNLSFAVASSGFNGLTEVNINGILILNNNDTIVYCEQAHASFSIALLLKGFLPVNNIYIGSSYINLDEVSQLLNKSDNDSIATESIVTTDESKSQKILNVTKKLLRQLSYFSMLNVDIENLSILSKTKNNNEQLILSECYFHKGNFIFNLTDNSKTESYSVLINGNIDASNNSASFHAQPGRGEMMRIPYFYHFTGIYLSSQELGGSISFKNNSSNSIELLINAATLSPELYHWRVSSDTVKLDSLGLHLNMLIEQNKVSTINNNYFGLNKLPIDISFLAEQDTSDSLSLSIGFSKIEAQSFFSSLPKGMFNSLQDITVKGSLEYAFNFNINFNLPESLSFNSEPKTENFKILNKGNFDFERVNHDFKHQVIENGKILRTIDVSPNNTFYTPLDKISPLLIYSVLTSEDGTFYFHKGFNKNALRQSIATNIKEKRFARGGSTITMQFVKNVFLNRDKNAARKFEEAILVWLIENQKLISKDRMLEVYLNIIEWGPNIYGIGEAASFYFNKTPEQLTLEESIYLSAIIPRPKYFKYAFEKDGTLKEYMHHYFDLVSGRLFDKGIISDIDTSQMNYNLQLSKDALQFIIPVDCTSVDSPEPEEEELEITPLD